jgi:hypothetical protein
VKLLIEGLMKEYETKKNVASLFTLNYPTIVRDHIADDQVGILSTKSGANQRLGGRKYTRDRGIPGFGGILHHNKKREKQCCTLHSYIYIHGL